MRVLIFLCGFETLLLLMKIEYDLKYRLVFVSTARYSWYSLMKPEFSLHIFEKYSNIKFHENPSGGIQVVLYERTDGHDEGNRRFPQF